MKKLLVLGLVLSMFAGYSQSSKEEVDYYQSIFGMGKKEVVAELISLDAETKDSFLKIYDEYETSRKELGKDRIILLEKYANGYESMSAEELNSIMKESMSLSVKTDKLIGAYYKRLEKEAGVLAASQFYHIESYLVSEIRVAIFGNIPMMEKIKK
ncbi:hypothetical protein [Owenweeksia hongkongensis]|uniref:hypothetical protein n=1 Tax=Owenweeksia hongkongensis TaxID=253245 RepID=UPI003A90CBCF